MIPIYESISFEEVAYGGWSHRQMREFGFLVDIDTMTYRRPTLAVLKKMAEDSQKADVSQCHGCLKAEQGVKCSPPAGMVPCPNRDPVKP